MTTHDPHRTIDAIWRIESAKIIAGLARIVGDVGMAEDLAQDALVIALKSWPESGIPENPGAWLMKTSKRRAIDQLRRNRTRRNKYEQLGREVDSYHEPDFDAAIDNDVNDDLLRLIFTTCHPILSQKARVALTLRLLGGLTTKEIASAFLVPEPTIAQRIVRAKRTLREAHVPFESPESAELPARLSSVLEVVYFMFNEGYAASSGEDWIRPRLCEEALRLGRVLAELAPGASETHGLAALMEIQSSRLKARISPSGEPILLRDQNRALWDQLLIRRGLAAIERAERLDETLGPYSLQAKIAACHATSSSASETDWVRISALYDALSQVAPSPVVELNRAVALSRAFGPEVGLEIVDGLKSEPSLKDYHLLPSVRGDILFKLGRLIEAHDEFQRAATLTGNARERELLFKRAAECDDDQPKSDDSE
ncbi:RNA polymerase sigma factor [Gracilibacillus timonensis]|uniref:RNA polymerase sigma factor n=1 Tax=Gracilibacillus timonensis TaxID=1816696 RepID=UPI0008243577|nr:RNA polymerase sigma factor [Gracilibacillus timonensis]